MNSYRKDIVQFTWTVSGILVLAIFLMGLFVGVEYSTTVESVIVQDGFCGVVDTPETATGKEIFNSNCAACHKVDGMASEPGLRGTSREELATWVQLQPISATQVNKREYGQAYHYETFNLLLSATDIEALYHYLNRLNKEE